MPAPSPSRGSALPFPGAPISFLFFEPRYLLLAERCLESGVPFGLQVDAASPLGVTVRIRAVDRLPGGHLRIDGVCGARYRVAAPPEQVPGEYGLYAALVDTFGDEEGTDAVTESTVAAWTAAGLDERAIAALRGARSERQRAALLSAASVAVLLRMLAGLSPNAVAALEQVHGPPPPATADVERWSYYAADVVAMPPDAKSAAFASRSSLLRLATVYAALAREAARLRVVPAEPPARSAAEQRADAATVAEAARAAGPGGTALDLFFDVLGPMTAPAVLQLLQPRASPLRRGAAALLAALYRPADLAEALVASAKHPCVSSVLVFAVLIALILMLRRPSGEVHMNDGIY